MNDTVGVAVVLCFCMLAVPIPMVPMFSFSQVHSYISNHQYELYFSFSVRCCALTFSHFPWFSLFPHFPQAPIFQEVWVFFFGGGGALVPHCSQNCLFRIFKPRFFPNPTHHFLELNGCVCFFFWEGGLVSDFS